MKAAAPKAGAQGVAGVIQMGRSQSYKTRRSRQNVLKRHLERAEWRTNASQVSALVFHNGMRVESISVVYKESYESPDNVYVYARATHDSHVRSSDGELFIIDKLNKFLPGYIGSINEGHYQNGDYHCYPPLDASKPRGTGHEFRIEIIGPRGTCGDCREALARYLTELRRRYPETPLRMPISFKINTRYVTYQQPGRRDYVNRGDDRSTYYGHMRAKRKQALGRAGGNKVLRRVPEHWKLKINASGKVTVDRRKPKTTTTTGTHIMFD
jgi:hypothetical protein